MFFHNRVSVHIISEMHVSTAYESIVVTTQSHPDAFPSALRQKRKIQTKVHESGETRTKVGREDLLLRWAVCVTSMAVLR